MTLVSDRPTSSQTLTSASTGSHANTHRSYSSPTPGASTSQPPNYQPFTSQDLAFYPGQYSQNFIYGPSPSMASSNPNPNPNPIVPIPHQQVDQSAGTIPPAQNAPPSYTPYHYPYVPSALPISDVNANAPSRGPESTWGYPLPTATPQYSNPETNLPYEPYVSGEQLTLVRSKMLNALVVESQEQPDSDDDYPEPSSSSGTVLNGPSSINSFQTRSNPATPISPVQSPDPYVSPRVMHRRSIERKARTKRRTAEREVQALLLSHGIAVRGKANMLNALLVLYK